MARPQLAVLATEEEAGAIAGKLAELGGAVELYEVTKDALDAVAEAAQSEPETRETPTATD